MLSGLSFSVSLTARVGVHVESVSVDNWVVFNGVWSLPATGGEVEGVLVLEVRLALGCVILDSKTRSGSVGLSRCQHMYSNGSRCSIPGHSNSWAQQIVGMGILAHAWQIVGRTNSWQHAASRQRGKAAPAAAAR